MGQIEGMAPISMPATKNNVAKVNNNYVFRYFCNPIIDTRISALPSFVSSVCPPHSTPPGFLNGFDWILMVKD